MAQHNDNDLRYVLESSIQASGTYQATNIQSPILEISHSQSFNTIPSLHHDYIISEDLLAGQTINGRMSSVRRFFCLFVTFDLLFVILMWVICIMLNGENLLEALKQQIYHYNIHTSLFDVVLTALCRFVALLLFYAVIKINHWIVIAISTTLSCSFLLGKVFLYDWPHSSQQVFEVLLILISFVLAWGEAWFFDFRVLPQECNSRRFLITNTDSERAPLIRSYVNALPSNYTESLGNFYSPLASPEGSMYRFRSEPVLGQYAPLTLSRDDVEQYMTLATSGLQRAWDISERNDWKLLKNSGKDLIYSTTIPEVGKVYKLIADCEAPPKCILDELFYKVESICEWNTSVAESYKVQSINEFTDIVYQVSAPWGGVVSSRDFITLRHWELVEANFILAWQPTEHPSVQKNDKFIRGENVIGCMIMGPNPESKNSCRLTWVISTNLKGWVPQYILDPAMMAMMLDYIASLRRHLQRLKEHGKMKQDS